MKQSNNLRANELFPGSDVVRKFSFKAFKTRDKSAFFTITLPLQVAKFTLSKGKSVLFQIIDCFECLSPQHIVA